MENRFIKDTATVLDYMWDWSDWLAVGETIDTAVVTTMAGLTIDSQSHTNTAVTVWLSGGTDAETYLVECLITTSNIPPRTDQRHILISCVDYA
jgi:hypothetical protein